MIFVVYVFGNIFSLLYSILPLSPRTVLKSIFDSFFFQLDFPVYFVTRGSKFKLDLILTFLCDFYKIFNNCFLMVLIKVNFKECCVHFFFFCELTFLAKFFGSLLGRSVILKFFLKMRLPPLPSNSGELPS